MKCDLEDMESGSHAIQLKNMKYLRAFPFRLGHITSEAFVLIICTDVLTFPKRGVKQ